MLIADPIIVVKINHSTQTFIWVSSKRHALIFKLKSFENCLLSWEICFLEDPLFKQLISLLQHSCSVLCCCYFMFFVLTDEIHSWKGPWLSGNVWEDCIFACFVSWKEIITRWNIGYHMLSLIFSFSLSQTEV